ncbi:MAG: 3-methyl-2-oxobutanoate hydroxymethyltransferase, partial [Phycisphaerales bacterium]
ASMLLIEGTAAEVTEVITSRSEVPVVGIGAGPHCDGQILVGADVLGLTQGPSPKFSKHYDNLADRSIKAFTAYSSEVRNGQYPDAAHSYHMKPGEAEKLQSLLEKP